jgi:hypothetical protein
VTIGREVDHIINKARGGTDDAANLQTICRACHAAKTAAESASGSGGVGGLNPCESATGDRLHPQIFARARFGSGGGV